MQDFVAAQGNVFLAHRLRRSSDRIVDQVGEMLPKLGLTVPPRGASMLLLLDEEQPLGVVDIARALRLSHPLIVRMAKQFEALGLVEITTDPGDARKRLLVPTENGRIEAGKLRRFNTQLSAMFDSLFAEIDFLMIAGLDRLDAALASVPISSRLVEETAPERRKS
jgi:DNA-binding MarR family transcriptional regulator